MKKSRWCFVHKKKVTIIDKSIYQNHAGSKVVSAARESVHTLRVNTDATLSMLKSSEKDLRLLHEVAGLRVKSSVPASYTRSGMSHHVSLQNSVEKPLLTFRKILESPQSAARQTATMLNTSKFAGQPKYSNCAGNYRVFYSGFSQNEAASMLRIHELFLGRLPGYSETLSTKSLQ